MINFPLYKMRIFLTLFILRMKLKIEEVSQNLEIFKKINFRKLYLIHNFKVET